MAQKSYSIINSVLNYQCSSTNTTNNNMFISRCHAITTSEVSYVNVIVNLHILNVTSIYSFIRNYISSGNNNNNNRVSSGTDKQQMGIYVAGAKSPCNGD